MEATHNKTGNKYNILHTAIDATNSRDGNQVVVYEREGKVFVRNLVEFKEKFTIDNIPTFKIHGAQRKQVKKELSQLKSFVKNFWYYHQLDKDMASFYGDKEGFPMSDEQAKKKVDDANLKIKVLEEQLAVLYGT